MKKRSFFILVGCVLIWLFALALGLGLGLGLGLKKNGDSYAQESLNQSRAVLTEMQSIRYDRSFLPSKTGLLHWRCLECRLHLKEGRVQWNWYRFGRRIVERWSTAYFHSLLSTPYGRHPFHAIHDRSEVDWRQEIGNRRDGRKEWITHLCCRSRPQRDSICVWYYSKRR